MGISIKISPPSLGSYFLSLLVSTAHLFHLIQRSGGGEATTHLVSNLLKCQVAKMSSAIQAHTPIHWLSLNANTPCKWMRYPPRGSKAVREWGCVCVCVCLDLCAQIYACYSFTTRDWRSLHLYVCMCVRVKSVCVCVCLCPLIPFPEVVFSLCQWGFQLSLQVH